MGVDAIVGSCSGSLCHPVLCERFSRPVSAVPVRSDTGISVRFSASGLLPQHELRSTTSLRHATEAAPTRCMAVFRPPTSGLGTPFPMQATSPYLPSRMSCTQFSITQCWCTTYDTSHNGSPCMIFRTAIMVSPTVSPKHPAITQRIWRTTVSTAPLRGRHSIWHYKAINTQGLPAGNPCNFGCSLCSSWIISAIRFQLLN
jgi:hypothetical protein